MDESELVCTSVEVETVLVWPASLALPEPVVDSVGGEDVSNELVLVPFGWSVVADTTLGMLPDADADNVA